MTVEVNTRQYECSHGKAPRGYGMWAFATTPNGEPLWFTGKYADAKKQAVAKAKETGAVCIYTLP